MKILEELSGTLWKNSWWKFFNGWQSKFAFSVIGDLELSGNHDKTGDLIGVKLLLFLKENPELITTTSDTYSYMSDLL